MARVSDSLYHMRPHKDQDKLVALKGTLDMVGNVLQDKLVAGLWKNRFSRDL